MKLALFSQNITEKHKAKLQELLPKPFEEINFLYINTPGNYKPYKSEWMMKGEEKWRNIFPKFQEFDLERAYRIDPQFDFKNFLEKYDFIFVSGGNTFILSYWMQKTGAREVIRDLILQNKIVYGGESAGAIYTYKDLDIYKEADDPAKAPEQVNECLGVIDFAPIPHWGNAEYDEALQIVKQKFEAENIKTYVFTDDQALFVEDDKVEIIN